MKEHHTTQVGEVSPEMREWFHELPKRYSDGRQWTSCPCGCFIYSNQIDEEYDRWIIEHYPHRAPQLSPVTPPPLSEDEPHIITFDRVFGHIQSKVTFDVWLEIVEAGQRFCDKVSAPVAVNGGGEGEASDELFENIALDFADYWHEADKARKYKGINGLLDEYNDAIKGATVYKTRILSNLANAISPIAQIFTALGVSTVDEALAAIEKMKAGRG